jgi:ATP/maltotriose-dependent transcriptional regulator MalT
MEGRPDEVGRFARQTDVDVHLKDTMPQSRSTLTDEARALLAVRLAQARGEYAEAARVTRRWHAEQLKAGWRLAATRWAILTANLEALGGDRGQARRTLLAAAVQGRDVGMIRSFLDGGEVVMSLLAERCGADSPLDNYLDTLIQHWNAQEGNLTPVAPQAMSHYNESDLAYALDALTEREIEILRRVGHGQINREIGAGLGLTEGSVKWYLNRIYPKIGVNRRTQAVKRAKQLGLIQ